MTLEELYALKRYLEQQYDYQARLVQQDVKDYKVGKIAVLREIQLKEMDPRKN